MKKLFSFLTFSFLALVLVPFFAQAAPALESIPDAVKSKYTFDGAVRTAVSDGEMLYIGGSFTTVTLDPLGTPTEYTRNYLAAINLTDYTLTSFDPNLNADVYALALSSDGGTLYVGGDFTCVGGEFEAACLLSERTYLAALDTTTGLPTSFNPEPNSNVNALVLSSDNTTLFAGGAFVNVNGPTSRSNLAAFTTADGVATAFDPQLDATVNALALSSDDVYIYATGAFGEVNSGVSQERLAVFNTTTGSTTPFNRALNGSGEALALSSDDATLYVGGSFTTSFIESGEGVPFDETTEEEVAVYPRVRTEAGEDATVYASVPDGVGGWYIGGSFSHVDNIARASLAHIDASGALDTDFAPTLSGDVRALELSPDGSVLYAGGSFTSGSEQYTAAFNTTNGAITAFSPYPGGAVYDLELSSDGETLYLGGSFGTMTGGFTPRFNVAAMDTTGAGTLLALDPQISNEVYALQLTDDGSTLYIGGAFINVNTETTNDVRNRIAAFDTTGAGTMTTFNPNADGTVLTLAFSGDETTLYAGGSFANIGGAVREEFAELDIVLNGTATALDAEIVNPMGDTVLAIALSSDESTIYIGGENFSTIDGEVRTTFAEIDATTGAVTDFNPRFEDAVRSISVATSTGEVYIGGSFTQYGSVEAIRLVAIDVSDDSLVSTFEPTPDATVRGLALSSDNLVLYAGGDFTDVHSGTTRGGLAALDTTDGSVTTFDPTGTYSLYALTLASDDSELYIGNYDGDNSYALLVFDGPSVAEDSDDSSSNGGSSSRRRPDDGVNVIVVLMNRIRELLLQLIAQGGTVPPEMLKYLTPVADTTTPPSYTRDLDLNSEGSDVTKLQSFLITQNKGPQAQALAQVGATGFFGSLTQSALAEYQASVGITPAVGYFGPITRAYLISIGAW